MTRDSYRPDDKTIVYSMKNEPSVKTMAFQCRGTYPDMYETYHRFSKKFRIPMDNFILTNGCENAARWAFLFFRDKKIWLEHPGWGMTKVICEAFGIEHGSFEYHYDQNSNRFYTDSIPDGVVYTTDRYNNLFMHENVPLKRGVLDETYTLNTLLNAGRSLEKNKIVIGSFSKFAGCDLRLGYVLFHKAHNSFFQMMREQYINKAAVDFICNHLDGWSRPELIEQTKGRTVTYHPVYATFRKNAINVPYKGFEVDGVNFCRVGRVVK